MPMISRCNGCIALTSESFRAVCIFSRFRVSGVQFPFFRVLGLLLHTRGTLKAP